MKKKSLIALFLAIVFLFQVLLPANAGSGTLTIQNVPFFGSISAPYQLYINEDKTSEETLRGQVIKTTVGDKESTRQSIVNAPTEGGNFDFNAIFKIDQSAMWSFLFKPSDNQVQAMPQTQNAGVESYVDLVVNVDERITPAETISAYFDSTTWRPVYVFDKDYTLLKDIRSDYVVGQRKTEFTFPSNGKTDYIVRVVPIDDNRIRALKEPLKFGFDGEGNTNFTISKEVANQMAEARRAMTDEDLEKEKGIIAKRNVNLTAEEITFFKTI